MTTWLKVGGFVCVLALLMLSVAKAECCVQNCITATNAVHAQKGRVTYKTGDQGEGYYSKGDSETYLGRDANEAVSLGAAPEAFTAVEAYYSTYGYEAVDYFPAECGNVFGVVFQKSSCPCCCFVVYVQVTSWVKKSCDQDCDGLTDEWELSTFGDMDQNSQTDFDGDGSSDYVEFLAGTNATDRGSIPTGGNYYTYDSLGRMKNTLRMD